MHLRIGIALLWVGWCAHGVVTLDESPAQPGEWGYRPFDVSPGESGDEAITCTLNPPGFSWRPCDGATGYALQVASDPGFGTVVYSDGDLPWPAHCPPEPFPEGTYYWRYAARDAETRTDWSKTRVFHIGSDSVVFPQPPIEELTAGIPDGHPRLFFRPGEVAELRRLARGPLQEPWEHLVARADQLIQTPPDTSEPPKYPEGTVRLSEEWRTIWWGNRRRVIAVADGAATLGFVYQITGEARYGAAARDLLVAMAKWDPEGSTSYRYNDEAAMPALYMTSRAYSWVYPVLEEADRQAIVEMMRLRGTQTFEHLRGRRHLWRPYASHSNRAWHFLGEVAVAFHGEIPEADRWLDYAMTIFFTAYPVWGDSDGGWHEGTAYWQSYTGRFMYWAYVMRSMFDIDVFRRPFYQRAGYYGMYLVPPGTEVGGFSDQAPLMTSKRIAPLVAQLAANAQNPHWQWYADEGGAGLGGGYLGFLYRARAGDLEAKAPVDLPSSAVFRGTGIAVLNSSLLDGTANVQVQFKSSPMGRQSHGYNANNAFLLNVRGKPLLVRSGRRDIHGSEHHKEWMWHAKSDNAILVNGRDQIRHSPAAVGRITAFETGPTVDVVVGEAGDSYENLDRWTRRIVFLKPEGGENLSCHIVIHDVLEAPEPSTFQWLLHAPGPFEIGENAASWEGEAGRLRVRFLEPAGLEIAQTDQYDPPPAAWRKWNLGEWHLTAATHDKATHREFLTVIAVDDASLDSQLEKGDAGSVLTLPTARGTATLELHPNHFRVRLDGFDKSF